MSPDLHHLPCGTAVGIRVWIIGECFFTKDPFPSTGVVLFLFKIRNVGLDPQIIILEVVFHRPILAVSYYRFYCFLRVQTGTLDQSRSTMGLIDLPSPDFRGRDNFFLPIDGPMNLVAKFGFPSPLPNHRGFRIGR